MRRARIIDWLASHLLLIIGLLVALYPIYWVLQLSLKTHVEAFKVPPSWIFWPTFENYERLLLGSDFPNRFANSFIVSSVSTVLALAIGTPAAYVFSRLRFRFKNYVLLFVLTSRMIPPISFILPYFMAYVNLGLMDTRIGLILVYVAFSLGLVVWSMWTFFDEIPRELDEAARVDGATIMQTVRQVILPLAKPGLASTAILVFIMAWNDFLFALILTRTQAVTAPVAITRALAYEAEDLGLMTAGAIAVSLPAVLFSILMRRNLRRGLLSGSIKG